MYIRVCINVYVQYVYLCMRLDGMLKNEHHINNYIFPILIVYHNIIHVCKILSVNLTDVNIT